MICPMMHVCPNTVSNETTMSEAINSEDCAKLLHCTTEQVEELARAGEIPGLKLGRGWLFVRADLLAYLAEKARSEAQERRARRQPATNRTPDIKPRRRQPPVLPALNRG
jgi:excisionase family DNA binding protein